MTGFAAFLGKEFLETRRTWRLWVIPGMLVFFGLSSPIITLLTPVLVKSIASSQPGMVIQLPPPTAFDAYAQFLRNLDQFVLIAVVITGAGAISGERSAGTAILMLTKPLSRGAFVVAKVVSQVALLAASTVLGTVACVALTAMMFDGAVGGRLITAVALWLVHASIIVVGITLFSAASESRGAAAGAGLVLYFLTLLLSTLGPVARYGFPGLIPLIRDALLGSALAPGWPVGTAAAAMLAGVAAAVWLFERREL